MLTWMMHHKYVKMCNGRTQDLTWYSATPLEWYTPVVIHPPKIMITDFIKTDENYVKIWKFNNFGKIMILGLTYQILVSW